jgi:hypothetical protein
MEANEYELSAEKKIGFRSCKSAARGVGRIHGSFDLKMESEIPGRRNRIKHVNRSHAQSISKIGDFFQVPNVAQMRGKDPFNEKCKK